MRRRGGGASQGPPRRLGRRAAGVLCAALCAAGPAAGEAAAGAADSAQARVAAALALVHLSPGELALPLDYEPPDPWRLAAVDSAMTRPLATDELCESVARGVCAGPVAVSLEAAGEVLRRSAPAGAGSPPAAPQPPAAAASTAFELRGPPALAGPVAALLRAASEARRLAVQALDGGITPAGRERLWREGPRLIEEDVDDPGKTIFQLEEEKWEEERLAGELLRLAEPLDVRGLRRSAILLAAAMEECAAALERLPPGELERAAAELSRASTRGRFAVKPRRLPGGGVRAANGRVEGDVLLHGFAGEVEFVLGGPGPTAYRGAFDVILDLGGDDLYLEGAGGTSLERPLSACLDLAGDDRYGASAQAGLAAGYLGVGMLFDRAGNDGYLAGNFGLGCGWYGVGVLADFAGDDRYRGDTAVEGAAHAGAGILTDRAGADTYEAAFASQGFGFSGGLGALDDREGNDFYLVRPRYADILRYEDHYVTLSQGFGFGHRPIASGGVGLLADRAGNDVYLCDIYGQGAAYWYALGGLVDGGGNDTYAAHQYAQGAGIHLAAAALVDGGGTDRYLSHGVSQGCGHDLGVGLLRDRGGADHYTASSLSQGAGSANGIGMLLDESGNDGYWAMDPANTHGYGNPRREYGSVGLLLDLEGEDRYAAVDRDSSAWTGEWFGAALDWPALSPPPPDLVDQDSIPVPPGGEYTPDLLFILASAGEPRFEDANRWAREALLARGTAAMPALLARLGTTDARDRLAVRELLQAIGEPAVEPLAKAVREGGRRERSLAAATLGYLGSGSREAAAALREAAADTSWPLRETALTALGRLRSAESADLLERALAFDEQPMVRKAAAWSRGRIGGAAAAPALVGALGDSHGMVRETARRALVSLDSLALPALSAAAAAAAPGSERAAALALEALSEIRPGLGARAALAASRTAAWSSAELRIAAVRALARESAAGAARGSGRPEFAALEAALAADDDPSVRLLARRRPPP